MEVSEVGSKADEVEYRAKRWVLWLFDSVKIDECIGWTAVAFGELV